MRKLLSIAKFFNFSLFRFRTRVEIASKRTLFTSSTGKQFKYSDKVSSRLVTAVKQSKDQENRAHLSSSSAMNELPRLYDETNQLQMSTGIKLFEQIRDDLQKSQKKQPECFLDVGCGTGNVTARFFDVFPQAKQLVAFDLSEVMIEYARIRHHPLGSDGKPDPRLRFEQASVVSDFEELCKKIGLTPGSVDICFSVYVLHWVYERSLALSNLRRLLKPGGGKMYCILFAYSDVLAIQSVLTQQPKWKQYFTAERMRVPIEEVEQHFYDSDHVAKVESYVHEKDEISGIKPENGTQSNGQKQPIDQVSGFKSKTELNAKAKPTSVKDDHKSAKKEETVEKNDLQKLGTKLRTSSPFELPGKPDPAQLEAYWRALCVKAGFHRTKVNVKYHEYYFKYDHADEMLRANTSLCHQVAYLPKELHEEYLEEYRQFLMENYCKLQPTFPEIHMRCDYILIEAEV